MSAKHALSTEIWTVSEKKTACIMYSLCAQLYIRAGCKYCYTKVYFRGSQYARHTNPTFYTKRTMQAHLYNIKYFMNTTHLLNATQLITKTGQHGGGSTCGNRTTLERCYAVCVVRHEAVRLLQTNRDMPLMLRCDDYATRTQDRTWSQLMFTGWKY